MEWFVYDSRREPNIGDWVTIMLFDDYGFDSKNARSHARITVLWGLIPISFSGVLLLSLHYIKGSGLIFVFGSSLGLECILAGVYRINRPYYAELSRLSQRLQPHTKKIHAQLFFWSKPFFIISFFISLGIVLRDLGLPTTRTIETLFLLLLVLVPVRLVLLELNFTTESPLWLWVNELCLYVMGILSTILVALFLIKTITLHPMTKDMQFPTEHIAISLFAGLICLWLASLAISRLPIFKSHNTHRKKQRQAQPSVRKF